jgi:50S ribosomal protein L16 3-hydroxylase
LSQLADLFSNLDHPMDISQPLTLLGHISPQTFMTRYWQKKPLVIRQAIPQFKPLLDRSALFDLACDDDVESRLVAQVQRSSQWKLKSGPFARRTLPALKTPGWTLLVQGVDLHNDAVRALMDQFRFIPDARLDDVMISFATEGGGVGPHFDSYDVFLLQAHGRRQWQISAQKDLTLQDDVPLKILANFAPAQTFVLEPGDMLYLPPRYAHDGVALDECMTYSIGFRAPKRGELAAELLQRLADDAMETAGAALYKDAGQPAVANAAEIPLAVFEFAQKALLQAISDPAVLKRALGEYLSEPKANVWFDEADALNPLGGVSKTGLRLDRRTKMLLDDQHVFINGESFKASGRDAALLKQFANARFIDTLQLTRASVGAKSLLQTWLSAGWIHSE